MFKNPIDRDYVASSTMEVQDIWSAAMAKVEALRESASEDEFLRLVNIAAHEIATDLGKRWVPLTHMDADRYNPD